MSDKSTWKEIGESITEFAPALGIALAPVTGGASLAIGGGIAAIGRAFGLGDNPTPDSIKGAIAADPQSSLKLMIAEQSFKLEQQRLDLDNTKDARNRQIEHEKATGKTDVNLYVLAWSVVLGFFSLVGMLLYFSYNKTEIVDKTGVLFMLLGALSTGFGMVLQYFFGSSAGSTAKTAMMEKMKVGPK